MPKKKKKKKLNLKKKNVVLEQNGSQNVMSLVVTLQNQMWNSTYVFKSTSLNVSTLVIPVTK